MIRAAGILCVAPNGHVLLVRRTDGQGWAFPGGGIEDGESPEDAARREFLEETGQDYKGKLTPWTRRIQRQALPGEVNGTDPVGVNEVDFTTFIVKSDEFIPTLNAEHDRWQWVDREFAFAVATNSGLIHPGCQIALRRFDMNELGLAKAIRDGELTSPQRYANLLLVAIRITGTGIAYRPSLEEFTWRDSELYLNSEFLERCNGLPVILEHPKSMLNTKEFHSRTVGTVFIPYIKGTEVWGIVKVFDMKVAEMLETEKMSTSPMVICGGPYVPLKDGETLLIEDKPDVVDHIALLYADGNDKTGEGVWDKGEGMAGVDSVDAVVDDPSNSVLDILVNKVKVHELVQLARN